MYIIVDDEAIKLAEAYITEGALTNKSYNDALHIALATLNNADVLASWNFRHIVNIDRIRLYNSINLRFGQPIDGLDAVKIMREIREKLSEKYWKHPNILKKEMEEIRKKYNIKLTEKPAIFNH